MTELLSPILKDGLRSPNFFNGRLVSGEDLTTEHDAAIERLARLGQAVGSGVACGLWVKPGPAADKTDPPALTVEAGLAVNRCGQTIKLAEPASVTLVRGRPSAETSVVGGQFRCCVPLKTGGRLTGDGVYVLTIAPATGREGRAPVNGLSPESARCNSKYLVEGVQFNLIPIGDPFLTDNDFSPTNLPYLRNRVAYKCFGVEELAAFTRDPFGADLKEYGLMDKLRKAELLSDCEVPLAIVHWTALNSIEFVDMWTIRRRITRTLAEANWPVPVGDGRISEGEAMILQFQNQINDLRSRGNNLALISANQHFRFLPPAGILPLADSGPTTGFEALGFFSKVTFRNPVFIEGARVGNLIRTSFSFPPIDLNSQEMIWIYFVRENQQSVHDAASSSSPQSYLVFATGHIPYQGDAHFDISHWNFSNYS